MKLTEGSFDIWDTKQAFTMLLNLEAFKEQLRNQSFSSEESLSSLSVQSSHFLDHSILDDTVVTLGCARIESLCTFAAESQRGAHATPKSLQKLQRKWPFHHTRAPRTSSWKPQMEVDEQEISPRKVWIKMVCVKTWTKIPKFVCFFDDTTANNFTTFSRQRETFVSPHPFLLQAPKKFKFQSILLAMGLNFTTFTAVNICR